MANGLIASLIIYSFNIIYFFRPAFRKGGQTADLAAMGTAMFTCIVWVVNCQIALTMSHFTWIQHFFISGSIVFWYVFLYVYGMVSPVYTEDVYRILVEVLAPAPSYWLMTLLVTVACNVFYFSHLAIQSSFNPMDHHVIQEIKYYKKDVEDKQLWRRERSKARQKTKIGFTARVEAKIRHLKGRLHKKQSSSNGSQAPMLSSASSREKNI